MRVAWTCRSRLLYFRLLQALFCCGLADRPGEIHAMREPKFDPRTIYRYDKELGVIYIDIDLDFYRELYSEWDFSPQRNRDLDEDLLEYLVSCCDEIPARYPLAIAINLPAAVYDATREERATQGFHNFFTYRIRREKIRYRRNYVKIFKYLLIGALLLIAASLLEQFPLGLPHSELLAEGLVIGAWVSIWEVFSVIFFKLSEHREKIDVFRRLLAAAIVYRYRPVPQPDNPTPDEADLYV